MQYRQCKIVASTRHVSYLQFVIFCIPGAVLGLGAGSSLAAEFDLFASYSAEYSNNVRLEPTAPIADLAHVINVGTNYQQTGTRIEARILANVQYRKYTNGTFADDLRPSLDASETWFLSPGRFHWFVQDRLSQITVDPLAPSTLDNLETINIFTTGPTFKARLGPVDSVELETRYTNLFYSQTSGQDSDRFSEKVQWLHALSPITDMAINLQAQQVDFALGVFDNYRLYETVLGLKTRRRNTTIGLDLGSTAIDREVESDLSGPLARLLLDYRPNPTTRIGLTVESRYSDITREILLLPLSQDPNIQTGNIFYQKRADVVYEQAKVPVKARLNLFQRERDYIDATPDEESYGGLLEISYDFNSRFNGEVFANYVKTNFVSAAPIADSGSGLRTTYRLRSELSWLTEIRWNKRDSTDTARTYDEFVAVVSLVYGRRPDLQQQ